MLRMTITVDKSESESWIKLKKDLKVAMFWLWVFGVLGTTKNSKVSIGNPVLNRKIFESHATEQSALYLDRPTSLDQGMCFFVEVLLDQPMCFPIKRQFFYFTFCAHRRLLASWDIHSGNLNFTVWFLSYSILYFCC